MSWTAADQRAKSGKAAAEKLARAERAAAAEKVHRLAATEAAAARKSRLIAGAKKRHADIMLEIATARGALYPFGKHQERAINFVPLLARYGLALRDDMRTEADRHAAQLVGADAVSETSPEAVAVRGQS